MEKAQEGKFRAAIDRQMRALVMLEDLEGTLVELLIVYSLYRHHTSSMLQLHTTAPYLHHTSITCLSPTSTIPLPSEV